MSPQALIILVGCITLVAVAVILYVLVFHKKLKKAKENHDVKKEKKAAEYSKSTNMAADVFEGRKVDEATAKENTEAFKKDVDRIINPHKHVVEEEKKQFNPFDVKTPTDVKEGK